MFRSTELPAATSRPLSVCGEGRRRLRAVPDGEHAVCCLHPPQTPAHSSVQTGFLMRGKRREEPNVSSHHTFESFRLDQQTDL